MWLRKTLWKEEGKTDEEIEIRVNKDRLKFDTVSSLIIQYVKDNNLHKIQALVTLHYIKDVTLLRSLDP
jgi:hypothetical protein